MLYNYSVHRGDPVSGEVAGLAVEGIEFFFMTAYYTWLNEIEPLWRQVKYQNLPDRSRETKGRFGDTVEAALRGGDEAMRNNMPLPATSR